MKKGIKVSIVGYGEIGKSVEKVYLDYPNEYQVSVKDLVRDDGVEDSHIMHICIPYVDESFVDTVSDIVIDKSPNIVIVNSTTAVGTTEKIRLRTKTKIAHSPVRGVHPNLYEGLKTFVKFIGTDDQELSKEISEHYESLNIETERCMNSETTELAKILSTTYYGVIIAWHGEMKKMCDKYEVDFEKAATEWNRTYNEGYSVLGKSNVIRPVLYPPPPSIGGHCVVPNVKILKKEVISKALELIMDYE